MHDERRKYPRADLDFDLEYYEETTSVATGGKNICAGGMAFRTRTLLAPGTLLRLVFSAADEVGEIRARARVVRSWDENGETIAAAEFFEIDAANQKLLARLVANYLKTETLPV